MSDYRDFSCGDCKHYLKMQDGEKGRSAGMCRNGRPQVCIVPMEVPDPDNEGSVKTIMFPQSFYPPMMSDSISCSEFTFSPRLAVVR